MGLQWGPADCSVLSAATGFGVRSTLPVQKSVLLRFASVLTSLLSLVEGRSGEARSCPPPPRHLSPPHPRDHPAGSSLATSEGQREESSWLHL